MSARCGEGRASNCCASGRLGRGSDRGRVMGARGDLEVGAWLIYSDIRRGTAAGVIFSMTVKAGRRMAVVGSE